MRILIVGATSSLGKRLVQKSIELGHDVVCFSRSAATVFKGMAVVARNGDILSLDDLSAAAAGCTHIVNCAVSYDPRTMEQVNVHGAENVARVARSVDAKRVIHVSTLSVYPLTLDRRHRETDRFEHVIDSYQRTKQLGEIKFKEACESSGISWTCIRPGAMFGPESHWSKIASQPMPWIQGTGEGTIFAVYIDDVVDLVLLCLRAPAAVGEVFNAVLDPPPARLALWQAHRNAAGKTCHFTWFGALARYLFIPAQYFPNFRGGRAHFISMITRTRESWSAHKAKRLLGWQASTSLSEGASRYIKWQKQQS